MKKIAVVLSGCGNQDGAEITEAVSALIALSEAKVQTTIFAPDKEFHPTNHLTGEPDKKVTRNCLTEAGRIARGKIETLTKLNPDHHDGLVIPGGYGVALHLCDWATQGAKASVHPEMSRIIQGFHSSSKPIGAICIAPALIALVLGRQGVTLTLGNNKDVIAEVEKTGAQHAECPPEDFITDRLHKVITTPAYMYNNTEPFLIFKGIRGLIKELVEMA